MEEAPKKKRGRPKGQNNINNVLTYGKYETPNYENSINEFRFYNTPLFKKFLSWLKDLNVEYLKITFHEDGIRMTSYDIQTDISVLFNMSYKDNYYYHLQDYEKIVELTDLTEKLSRRINKDIVYIDFVINNMDEDDNFMIYIPIGEIGAIPIKINSVQDDVELDDIILPSVDDVDVVVKLSQKDFKTCISGAGSTKNTRSRNIKINLSIEYNAEEKSLTFGLDNSTTSHSYINNIPDADINIINNEDILHIIPFEKIKPMNGNNMTEKIRIYLTRSELEVPLMFKLNITDDSYIHYITNAIIDDK